jgi:ribosome-associated protein
MHAEELCKISQLALEEIKARDVTVLDTRKMTSLFDFMIVASADSARQTKALARNIADKVKQAGGSVIGVEGEQTGEWVLVDLGDVLVHIMQPAIREYYNLEPLWGGDAPRRVSPLRPAMRTGESGSAPH